MELKIGQKAFSWRTVKGQCRKVREKLFLELQRQYTVKDQIKNLQNKVPLTSKVKSELKSLESSCWWEMKNGNFILRRMKVVEYIQRKHGQIVKETWADCEDYVRILSRSCLRRAAQSHVELLISIIGNHSRGQSWDKVLTEISYKH